MIQAARHRRLRLRVDRRSVPLRGGRRLNERGYSGQNYARCSIGTVFNPMGPV
jgi:hypothetical protein